MPSLRSLSFVLLEDRALIFLSGGPGRAGQQGLSEPGTTHVTWDRRGKPATCLETARALPHLPNPVVQGSGSWFIARLRPYDLTNCASLSFLICKMGVRTAAPSEDCPLGGMREAHEALRTAPGAEWVRSLPITVALLPTLEDQGWGRWATGTSGSMTLCRPLSADAPTSFLIISDLRLGRQDHEQRTTQTQSCCFVTPG